MQETLRKPISSIMEHRLNQILSAVPYKFLSASTIQVRDHHRFPESLQGVQGNDNSISRAGSKCHPPSLLSAASTSNASKADLSLQNPPSRV